MDEPKHDALVEKFRQMIHSWDLWEGAARRAHELELREERARIAGSAQPPQAARGELLAAAERARERAANEFRLTLQAWELEHEARIRAAEEALEVRRRGIQAAAAASDALPEERLRALEAQWAAAAEAGLAARVEALRASLEAEAGREAAALRGRLEDARSRYEGLLETQRREFERELRERDEKLRALEAAVAELSKRFT